MTSTQPQHNKTISAYHQMMRLPKPQHPLISVVKFEDIKHLPGAEAISLVNEFYAVGLKRNFDAKMKYGQQEYDF